MQTATLQSPRQTSFTRETSIAQHSEHQSGRPVEEFMDELAKRLGKHYGLNDIREAL